MSGKRVDTVRLQNIAQGFVLSAALMSAVELGIFTAINGGAITSEPFIPEALTRVTGNKPA